MHTDWPKKSGSHSNSLGEGSQGLGRRGQPAGDSGTALGRECMRSHSLSLSQPRPWATTQPLPQCPGHQKHLSNPHPDMPALCLSTSKGACVALLPLTRYATAPNDNSRHQQPSLFLPPSSSCPVWFLLSISNLRAHGFPKYLLLLPAPALDAMHRAEKSPGSSTAPSP